MDPRSTRAVTLAGPGFSTGLQLSTKRHGPRSRSSEEVRMPRETPNVDHPVFKVLKESFPSCRFKATEFRNQSTLIVEPSDLHRVMAFLRDDPRCDYNFLSDVIGVDYLNYPAKTQGRFAVIYNLISHKRDCRFFVKVFLDPTLPTDGSTPASARRSV